MMNSSLILKAIPVMNEGDLSFNEFAIATGLGKKTSIELIRFLARSEIGTIGSNAIKFSIMDKMRAALLAIQMGTDVEDLSRILNWRDFEILTTNILDASGYVAYHSVRLKKPRA